MGLIDNFSIFSNKVCLSWHYYYAGDIIFKNSLSIHIISWRSTRTWDRYCFRLHSYESGKTILRFRLYLKHRIRIFGGLRSSTFFLIVLRIQGFWSWSHPFQLRTTFWTLDLFMFRAADHAIIFQWIVTRRSRCWTRHSC